MLLFRRSGTTLLVLALLLLTPSFLSAEDSTRLRVHFHLDNHDYDGWGIYAWGPVDYSSPVNYANPMPWDGETEYGVYFDIPLRRNAAFVTFILHVNQEKNTNEDYRVLFNEKGYDVWILENDETIYSTQPDVSLRSFTSTTVTPDPIDQPLPQGLTGNDALIQELRDRLSFSSSRYEEVYQEVVELRLRVSTADTAIERRITTLEEEKSILEEQNLALQEQLSLALQSPEEVQIEAPVAEETPWFLSPIFLFSLTSAFLISSVVMAFLLLGINGRHQKEKQALLSNSEQLVKDTEKRLMEKSVVDELTGLPNRSALNQSLDLAISKAKRYQRKLALIFIDLDHFKPINDNLGHEAGDYVLKTIAERFRGSLRASDMVARLGGDEFIVLIEDLADEKFLSGVAQKLLSSAQKGFVIQEQEVFVSASVGISTFPRDGKDATNLLKHADLAMYKAKETGRNNFQYYSQELNTHSLERLALESSLLKAFEESQFFLNYLPVLHTSTGRVAGVEALIRWHHPNMGLIQPAQFISLAEDNGLIKEIGGWVLEEVGFLAAKLHPLYPEMKFHINISEKQLSQIEFINDVKILLKKTGIPGSSLVFELHESYLVKNPDEAIENIHSLKDLGIAIALDDFGTGYTSLSSLSRFPIDLIKIDRTCLQDVPHDKENSALTSAICSIGTNMGVEVVAEGIENEGQRIFIQSRSCPLTQGFLFSQPLPQKDLEEFLKAFGIGPD